MMSFNNCPGPGTFIAITDVSELADPGLLRMARNAVDAARLQKTDRYRMENDRYRSLAAGILFRHALRQCGFNPDEILIKEGQKGKPEIVNIPGLYFNLSHSGDRAMCILSAAEVGCDVEKIDTDRKVMDIASHFFSQSEKELLNSVPETERCELFFRLWTLKESFLKYTGEGLSLTLDSFSVVIGQGKICAERQNVPECVSFFEPELHDGYRYACCCAAAGKPEVHFVKLSEILNEENKENME